MGGWEVVSVTEGSLGNAGFILEKSAEDGSTAYATDGATILPLLRALTHGLIEYGPFILEYEAALATTAIFNAVETRPTSVSNNLLQDFGGNYNDRSVECGSLEEYLSKLDAPDVVTTQILKNLRTVSEAIQDWLMKQQD